MRIVGDIESSGTIKVEGVAYEHRHAIDATGDGGFSDDGESAIQMHAGKPLKPAAVLILVIIAIPSLMCYRYFRARVDEFQLAMELGAAQLLPHLLRALQRSGAAA